MRKLDAGAVEVRRGKRRYQRATQSDGLPWDEGLPVRELDGEKLHFGEKRVRGSRLARCRFGDEANPPVHPLPALDRRLDRRTSRKFVHRDEDLVNYLLSI